MNRRHHDLAAFACLPRQAAIRPARCVAGSASQNGRPAHRQPPGRSCCPAARREIRDRARMPGLSPDAGPGRQMPGPSPEPGQGPAPDSLPSERVWEQRRALGRRLASLRSRSGFSQWEFAPLTGYSRSTLSDAELGRHRLRREFWERCDEALMTDGVLTAAYDRIEVVATACAPVRAQPGAGRSGGAGGTAASGPAARPRLPPPAPWAWTPRAPPGPAPVVAAALLRSCS